MKTAYIVTVRPNTRERYTDSQWIDKNRAESRVLDLVTEFNRRGWGGKTVAATEGWAAWVTPVTIQNTELGEPRGERPQAPDAKPDGRVAKKKKEPA